MNEIEQVDTKMKTRTETYVQPDRIIILSTTPMRAKVIMRKSKPTHNITLSVEKQNIVIILNSQGIALRYSTGNIYLLMSCMYV